MTFEEAKAAYDEALMLEINTEVELDRLKTQAIILQANIHEAETAHKNSLNLARNRYSMLLKARQVQIETTLANM